ncbi:hypothetical protein STEG23_024661 [Scotinomys teguina]
MERSRCRTHRYGTRTAALRTESRMCQRSWFLDLGGWDKAAAVGLYFIFPGICTLSLVILYPSVVFDAVED